MTYIFFSTPGEYTKQFIINYVIGQAWYRLEARWRIVSYLNELLSKLEPKLENDKFEEVRSKKIHILEFS